MKKNVNYLLAAITLILVSCSKSGDSRTQKSQEAEYTALKEQIITLNHNLPPKETTVTRAKWWKYALVAAADAGGFFLAGGTGAPAITAGCTVSNLVWGFFKKETEEDTSQAETRALTQVKPSLLDSEVALSYVDGAGLIHNKVIIDLYEDYGESLFEYDDNTIITLVAQRVSLETNCTLAEASLELAERATVINKAVTAYTSASTINEFIDNLELAAPERTALLEIVNVILEGFDSIDAVEDNGNYCAAVQRLITESDLEVNDKEILNSTASVANASARLWNVED